MTKANALKTERTIYNTVVKRTIPTDFCGKSVGIAALEVASDLSTEKLKPLTYPNPLQDHLMKDFTADCHERSLYLGAMVAVHDRNKPTFKGRVMNLQLGSDMAL